MSFLYPNLATIELESKRNAVKVQVFSMLSDFSLVYECMFSRISDILRIYLHVYETECMFPDWLLAALQTHN